MTSRGGHAVVDTDLAAFAPRFHADARLVKLVPRILKRSPIFAAFSAAAMFGNVPFLAPDRSTTDVRPEFAEGAVQSAKNMRGRGPGLGGIAQGQKHEHTRRFFIVRFVTPVVMSVAISAYLEKI